MRYLFFGEDQFRIRQAERALSARLRKEGCEVRVFEPPIEWEELRVFLAARGLFSPHQAAVLRTASLTAPDREKLRTLWREPYIDSNDIHLLLVFEGRPPELEKKKAEITEYPLLKGLSFERWVKEASLGLGVRLDKEALRKFCEHAAPNTALAWQELSKLTSSFPGRVVHSEDLEFAGSADENYFFPWIDAVLARDRRRAISLLQQELRTGGDPMGFLAALTNSIRMLTAFSFAPPGEVRKVLEGSPFWISKHERAASAFTKFGLKRIRQALFQAEFMIKTGKMDSAAALESALLVVTGGQNTAHTRAVSTRR